MNVHTFRQVFDSGACCTDRVQMVDLDWSPFNRVKQWQDGTLGELVDVPDNAEMGELSLHQLAYYILVNVRGVKKDTPCRYTAKSRLKIIVVGDMAYRVGSHEGVTYLYDKRVKEIT
jgi:hypothetical protein